MLSSSAVNDKDADGSVKGAAEGAALINGDLDGVSGGEKGGVVTTPPEMDAGRTRFVRE